MDLIKVNEETKEIELAENIIEMLKDFQRKKVEFEIQEKKLKEELLEAMEKYGITNWNTPNEDIKVIYKKATTRKTIDSARLKNELPDIAEEYTKTSDVKSSVSILIEV